MCTNSNTRKTKDGALLIRSSSLTLKCLLRRTPITLPVYCVCIFFLARSKSTNGKRQNCHSDSRVCNKCRVMRRIDVALMRTRVLTTLIQCTYSTLIAAWLLIPLHSAHIYIWNGATSCRYSSECCCWFLECGGAMLVLHLFRVDRITVRSALPTSRRWFAQIALDVDTMHCRGNVLSLFDINLHRIHWNSPSYFYGHPSINLGESPNAQLYIVETEMMEFPLRKWELNE